MKARPLHLLAWPCPQLRRHLEEGLHTERWWYEESRKANCAVKGTFQSKEPKASADVRPICPYPPGTINYAWTSFQSALAGHTFAPQVRCSRFRSWLRSRPEQFVIVVGHANFFRTLTNSREYMKNCEILEYKM